MAGELAVAPEQATEAEFESRLLQLGQQADAGEIDPLSIDIATTKPKDASSATGAKGALDAPHPDGEGAKEKSAAERQPADGKANEAQESLPKDGEKKPEVGSQKSEAEKAEAKESDYTKAKKEQERRDNSWQKLEAEKAAFRAEREAFDKQKSEVVGQKSETAEVVKDSRGYTAEQYDQAAKDFEADGDTTLAAEARRAAETLRTHEQKASQERQTTEAKASWWKNANEVVHKNADLQNLETPLAKATQELLKTQPVFHSMPDGFERAVEIAGMRLGAAEVPALKSQIGELTKQLQAAHAKLALDPGSVERGAKEKSVRDMSLDEAERHVMRLAEAHDQEHGGIFRG